MILPRRTRRAPIGWGSLPEDAATTPPRSKHTVAAVWRSSEVTRSTPLFRPRSSSWKTSWMCRSLSGPSSATDYPADAAKMCWRSRADRARLRACDGERARPGRAGRPAPTPRPPGRTAAAARRPRPGGRARRRARGRTAAPGRRPRAPARCGRRRAARGPARSGPRARRDRSPAAGSAPRWPRGVTRVRRSRSASARAAAP